MKQLNINLTPEFDSNLKKIMRTRGFSVKVEAIRWAVREAAERAVNHPSAERLQRLLGAALRAPLNQNPRFKSNDELW